MAVAHAMPRNAHRKRETSAREHAGHAVCRHLSVNKRGNMSISLLQQLATQTLPLNVPDRDKVDEVRVLMRAGLIAAFEVREGRDASRPGTPVVRILAITSEGRRLIERCAPVPQVVV